MSQAYAKYPERTTFDLPDGGLVRSGGDVFAPNLTAVTPVDVAFGPVAIGTPSGSLTTVSDLSYATGQEDDGLPLIGVGILAAGTAQEAGVDRDSVPEPTPNPSTTRRAFLGLAAGILATSGSAMAQSDETVRLGLARFSVDDATGPLSVRVLDIVDEVLPTGTEILVDAAGTRVGKVAEPGAGVTLSKEVRGEVTVYLQGSKGLLERLLAWIRSFVGGDAGVTFARQLPKPAAEYDAGTIVDLSSHPSLVAPVEAGAPDEIRLRIGSSTIPHESESSGSELGLRFRRDARLRSRQQPAEQRRVDAPDESRPADTDFQ
jgi:hypothetical protein